MPCKGRQGVQCTLVNPRCFLLVCIKTFRHDWINLWLVIFIDKKTYSVSFHSEGFQRLFYVMDLCVCMHIVASKLLLHMCAECEQNECHTWYKCVFYLRSSMSEMHMP